MIIYGGYEYYKKQMTPLNFKSIFKDSFSKPIYDKYFENYKPKLHFKNLKFELFIDHDGCDSYGPESNLYDVYATWEEDKIRYVEGWHREYWYQGEDTENYYLNTSKRPIIQSQ